MELVAELGFDKITTVFGLSWAVAEFGFESELPLHRC